MYILGLNDSTSAATLIEDGKIVAAAREERFNRIKHSDEFPTLAIKYCLKEAGIGIKEVERIVFAWNPGHEIEPFDTSAAIRYHKDFLHYVPNNILNLIPGDKSEKKVHSIHQILELKDCAIPISFVPHHPSHAASAFFVSPFEKAAILTIDAYGDDTSMEMFEGEGNKITSLCATKFPYSLGSVYAAVTQYLGFRPNVDEWKVMGLAPYGEPVYYDDFSKIIKFNNETGRLWVNLDYFTYYIWAQRRYSDLFIETFGPERYYNDELDKRHRDIAASFQNVVEDVVLEAVNYLHRTTELDALCLAGGVVMNSKMNGRILKESPFTDIYIQPSADDAGASLGACFYWWQQIEKKPRNFIMEHDYWGPGYSNQEIQEVLDSLSIQYKRINNIEEITAKLIAEGKVVGWFQGRMEFSQRALGNRSILADPRDAKMKDKVNKLIKHRESFRPFAPSILEEYTKEYFDMDYPSPFMQMVYSIKREKQALIPAVTHVDGTGRLQTVSKKTNPKYWRLINEFRKITDIPLVLNTSFNDNNEPIVTTPVDAVRCFYGTGLEALAIGDFLITKSRE